MITLHDLFPFKDIMMADFNICKIKNIKSIIMYNFENITV